MYGWYRSRSHILHVRCERRPSNSAFSVLSCCTRVSRLFLCSIVWAASTTSSDRLGLGASSAFFITFCFRLSLLDGRVGLSPSVALRGDGRPAVGVPPRLGREEAAMFAGCWELLAAPEEAMDEDDVLGRAVAAAGGAGECLALMVRASKRRRSGRRVWQTRAAQPACRCSPRSGSSKQHYGRHAGWW